MASSELSFASPQNPQENSVFFTLFPKEVRDEIFDLAITPYEKREDFLPEDLQYNRPGFRNSYRRISTALLRTCQRIYAETCDIPAHNYIKIDWYFNNSSKHGHGGNDANFQKLIFPSKMQSLHVYTTSEDLELCVFWGKYIDQIATQAPDLRHLKMTLGNFDTETESVPSLLPDPNFPESEPNMYNIVNWGWHLQRLKNLMILEIEAETTINWMQDLDEAVARVKQWRIAVTSDKTLVLNPQKIGRDGWHGPVRTEPRYIFYALPSSSLSDFSARYCRELAPPLNAIEAEERLINAGVSSVQSEDLEGQASTNRLTFYAVTLVFEQENMVGQDHEIP